MQNRILGLGTLEQGTFKPQPQKKEKSVVEKYNFPYSFENKNATCESEAIRLSF